MNDKSVRNLSEVESFFVRHEQRNVASSKMKGDFFKKNQLCFLFSYIKSCLKILLYVEINLNSRLKY